MGGFYHILSKYHPILMFSVVELWETWHFQTVISRKNLVVREFLPATRNTSCCEPQPCKICLVSSNWFDQQLIVLFTNEMCLCNHLIAWIDSSTIFSVPFTAHFLWWSSWPKMAFLSRCFEIHEWIHVSKTIGLIPMIPRSICQSYSENDTLELCPSITM